MIECKICNREFDNKLGMSKHLRNSHNMNAEEYTLKYLLNNIKPTCKCGCGIEVSYCKEIPYTYSTYKVGHYVYDNPDIWGDKSDPIRLAKGAETYKKMYANGEIQHWSKGQTKDNNDILKRASEKLSNNKERCANISKTKTGKKLSKEHILAWKESMQKNWESEEFREKLSNSHINYLINNHKQYSSKLETFFIDNYLEKYSIKYTRNYFAKEIKSFYDFYIPELNIIIEVDGDYWHCNPEIYGEPKYENIKKNIEKDKKKNKWCEDNNITLIRFWENVIKNKPDEILEVLKKFKILS